MTQVITRYWGIFGHTWRAIQEREEEGRKPYDDWLFIKCWWTTSCTLAGDRTQIDINSLFVVSILLFTPLKSVKESNGPKRWQVTLMSSWRGTPHPHDIDPDVHQVGLFIKSSLSQNAEETKKENWKGNRQKGKGNARLGISLFIFYPFCFNTRSRCLDVLWLWKVGPTWKELLSTLKCNGPMVHLLTRTPTERKKKIPYRTKKLTGKKENICRSVRENGTSAFKCHCVVLPNGNTKSK